MRFLAFILFLASCGSELRYEITDASVDQSSDVSTDAVQLVDGTNGRDKLNVYVFSNYGVQLTNCCEVLESQPDKILIGGPRCFRSWFKLDGTFAFYICDPK